MEQMSANERWFLLRAGVAFLGLIVLATLAPIVHVLVDDELAPGEALLLMAGPLALLGLAAAIAGVAAAVRTASRNATGSRRTSEQGLRVGIVWVLGLSLLLLVGVSGVLAHRSLDMPDGLVALASSLAGGLIGVLAPRTATGSAGADLEDPEPQPEESPTPAATTPDAVTSGETAPPLTP